MQQQKKNKHSFELNLEFTERKEIIEKDFIKFEGNVEYLSIEELLNFLDKKSGKTFNRQLFYQICETIENSEEYISLDEFITQFIEIDDSANFKIQSNKAQIEKLFKKREEFSKLKEYETNNYCDNLIEESEIYINIIESLNLEPLLKNSLFETFVIIKCGNIKFETSKILNNRNPNWNENFKLYYLFLSNLLNFCLNLSSFYFIYYYFFNNK